ncbi:MAG: UDP-N-acetylglucosamine 2-epimerase (non-hydrolyzing) [Candidatus Neomarinimicrobiota bacterium]|nr:UDP-N-acetylglucosamine 2-epimerase (non-hydrolyzing) [Candidatus Neomarinimicrobiota bacterium]
MKIISVVGARPQFIKLAILSKELRENHNEIIIHTGQHYDDNMSRYFFEEMQIAKPDYNLNIGSGSHGKQTAEMLIGLEDIFLHQKPDVVITFGDTNTTLATGLAATKLNIPVAHVEAGLRSHNREMPEEINRILTDHISDYLFAPTLTAMENIKIENLYGKPFLVGDVMYDSLLYYGKIAEQKSRILKNLKLKQKEYILLTLHRPYNVDNIQKLQNIFSALKQTKRFIVLPVHPRSRKMIESTNTIIPENISIIEPLGYLDFIFLQKYSEKIITDSGGIQKEAYLNGIPCITIRPETEWIETVKAGWNVLVGDKKDQLIENCLHFKPSHNRPRYFGDGNSSKKIISILESHL